MYKKIKLKKIILEMMLWTIRVSLNLHFVLLKQNNLQEKHYYKIKSNQISELNTLQLVN